MEKKIAVVVVTYNGQAWIKKNMDSLLQSSYPVDIIVVDNASTDQSVSLLQEYKNVHLIESKVNLGFGKANNIGIDYALKNGADAVFLLNQDTWIYENTVAEMAEVLFANPKFGIVSPLHLSPDEVTLDSSFKTYYSRFKKEEDSESIRIVPFINAAAWLVSKECFQKVGNFEPLFSHYGEDRNFCTRVVYHQFKIAVAKKSAICHDRIVKLSSGKIALQSKYLVLNQMIDCNHSLVSAGLLALKSVVGLPKFHAKAEGVAKSLSLFYKLLFYYFGLLMDLKTIKIIRSNSQKGINGTDIQRYAK